MLCRTVSYLVELNTFVHLLMKTFSCRAVGRVESGIVTICTASATDLAVSVRASETGVKNYLLQSLSIFTLEVSDERVVSFPVRETIFLKMLRHVSNLWCLFLQR